MDKRKKMKIIFVVISIILVLVILEVGIKSLVSNVGQYVEKQKEEKSQEEFYNSQPEVNKRGAGEFIESICEAIKTSDYNYVYEHLDKTYSEYMFENDFENMKKYLKNIELGDKYTVTKVSKTANVYHVLVGIESGDMYTSRYFSVKKIEEGETSKYSFMFDEYNALKNVKYRASANNIVYNLNYILETNDYLIYVVDIHKSNNESTDIKVKNLSLITTNGKTVSGNLVENIGVENNDKNQRVHMVFPKKSSSNSFIQFDSIVNEKEDVVKIFMENGIS